MTPCSFRQSTSVYRPYLQFYSANQCFPHPLYYYNTPSQITADVDWGYLSYRTSLYLVLLFNNLNSLIYFMTACHFCHCMVARLQFSSGLCITHTQVHTLPPAEQGHMVENMSRQSPEKQTNMVFVSVSVCFPQSCKPWGSTANKKKVLQLQRQILYGINPSHIDLAWKGKNKRVRKHQSENEMSWNGGLTSPH